MIDLKKAKELAESGNLEELKEGGKFSIADITYKDKRLVCRADFTQLRKAYKAIINIDVAGKAAAAEIDILAGGDKILCFGAVLGQEYFTRDNHMRAIACQKLGEWVLSIMTPREEYETAEEQKKSLEEQ